MRALSYITRAMSTTEEKRFEAELETLHKLHQTDIFLRKTNQLRKYNL